MHKTIICLTLGLLFILQPAAQAEIKPKVQDLVTLSEGAEVEGEVVRLGDLFDGISDPGLAEIPVAKSPEPGGSVTIGARWLAAVAKAHGLPWQPRSRYERVNLTRSSHDIEADEIEVALRQALAEEGLEGDVRLALDNPSLRLRIASTGDRSLRVVRMTLDPKSGRFLAHVAAPAYGEPLASLSVTGRAVELTEVPVLGRNVKPGQVIQARDIEWISVAANRLTRTTVTDVADMIGMSPRRPIRSQNLIRSTDLETPVLVTKNSLVTIRLQTERLQLTVQGRAMEEGAEGDVVRVMNTASNNIVNAVVVDEGSVVAVPASTVATR